MGLIGKLSGDDASNIEIIPSFSNDVSIQFEDQCIQIIENKDRLNGLKSSTKMKNIYSLFKYQSHFYNIQRNDDVNHRGIKIRWNNKNFTSLNVINGKTSTYGSKVILRNFHYRPDPKLGPGIVAIR